MSITLPRYALVDLDPVSQMRAGRLGRRLPQLFVGLTLYGVAMAMMVRAGVGLDPWDVFHFGIARHTGWSLGLTVIAVSIPVLLIWAPLRQWPGLGTIANAIWIGIATDAGLRVIPTVHGLFLQCLICVTAIIVNGIGGALYIGSQLGPGPRDGLMTGLHRRTGVSLRVVRTGLEISVLAIGWLLGGVVGIGTVLYAVLIGPLVQFFLPWVIVPLEPNTAD
ncbi:membrane protein YczE [Calidifontibacter terrae]